jgi:hypothetical protein
MAAQSSTAPITTSAKFDIVGIAIGNRGRSCQAHHVCDVQVEEGTTIKLKREMILVDGLEEVVMSVYLVGGRGCRVGFTPRHRHLDSSLHHPFLVPCPHQQYTAELNRLNKSNKIILTIILEYYLIVITIIRAFRKRSSRSPSVQFDRIWSPLAPLQLLLLLLLGLMITTVIIRLTIYLLLFVAAMDGSDWATGVGQGMLWSNPQ